MSTANIIENNNNTERVLRSAFIGLADTKRVIASANGPGPAKIRKQEVAIDEPFSQHTNGCKLEI